MNLKLLDVLHEDDRRAMVDGRLIEKTNPASQAFVATMILMAKRAISESILETFEARLPALREEIREEFRSEIAELKSEIRELRISQQACFGQVNTLSGRVTETEKSCSANRRHVQNLDQKVGELKKI